MAVIEQTADNLKVPLIKSEDVKLEVISQSLKGSLVKYNGEEFLLKLSGNHQIENAKTALAAIEALNQARR